MPWCSGGTSSANLRVARGRRLLTLQTNGCPGGVRDAAAGGWHSTIEVEPGVPIAMSVRASKGTRTDAGSATDDVRVGLGLYNLPAGAVAPVGSMPVEVVEEHGQLWVLDRVVRSGPDAKSVSTSVDVEDGGTPVLVTEITSGTYSLRTQIQERFDGRPGFTTGGGGEMKPHGLATEAGTTASIRATGPQSAGMRLAIAVYQRAD